MLYDYVILGVMRKKDAIKALRAQQIDLVEDDLRFGSRWIIATKAYLYDFLGEDNLLVKDFLLVESSVRYHLQRPPTEELPILIKGYQKSFNNIIESAIKRINHVGLVVYDKVNIFSNRDNATIIGWGFGIITVFGGISMQYGKYLSDTQNIQLKSDNRTLLDSLSFYRAKQQTMAVPKYDTTNRTNH